MAQHNGDFDRIAALTSELEMMRMQVEETDRGYQEKIKGLERELTTAQDKLRLTASTTQVDMVEHQAMRQELEGLKQTVEDLQRELDEANEQSQNAEDILEDKNDKIERMSQEIDLLRGDMEEAEYKRRESEEARKQVEKSLYQLQEDMDKAVAQASVDTGGEEGGSAKSTIMGMLLGVLALLGGLEAFSFMQGKGELIALLQSKQPVVEKANGMAKPVMEKEVKDPKPAVVKTTEDKPTTEQAGQVATPTTEKVVEKPEVVEKVETVKPVESTPKVVEEATPEKPEEKAVEVEKEALTETVAENKPDPVPEKEAAPQPKVVQDDSSGHVLVEVAGGSYTMGNRAGSVRDETPAHEVAVKPFLIGQHEVTFAQYDRFANATGRALPSDNGWGRGDRPVINISWKDASAYVDWLSRTTGKKYRLPTESEWEYAAGSGSRAVYWWGYSKGSSNANCFNCGSQWDGRSPAPVGSFKANPYGLHDTAGNVLEWVQDCYKTSYSGVPADGSAMEVPNCGERVARGGAFNKPAASMRTSKRARFPENTRITSLGFRVARDL